MLMADLKSSDPSHVLRHGPKPNWLADAFAGQRICMIMLRSTNNYMFSHVSDAEERLLCLSAYNLLHGRNFNNNVVRPAVRQVGSGSGRVDYAACPNLGRK